MRAITPIRLLFGSFLSFMNNLTSALDAIGALSFELTLLFVLDYLHVIPLYFEIEEES